MQTMNSTLDICSNSFSELSTLNTHKIVYKCDVCENVFSHENDLKQHLLVHGQTSLLIIGVE